MSRDGSISDFFVNDDYLAWSSLYALSDPLTTEHEFSIDIPSTPHFACAFDSKVTMRQFFISRGQTCTQLHRDRFDNAYLCIRGRRKWTFCDAAHHWLESEPGSVSASLQPQVELGLRVESQPSCAFVAEQQRVQAVRVTSNDLYRKGVEKKVHYWKESVEVKSEPSNSTQT